MDYLKKKYRVVQISVALMNLIVIPLASFLYGRTIGEILEISGFAVFFTLGFLYFYNYLFHKKDFSYGNFEHPYRFLTAYSVSLVFTLLFPLVDREAWVFLCIAISVSLLSNSLLGIYVMSGFIFFSILLSGNLSAETFFVYFFGGFTGIILFNDIDENFKVTPSIITSSLVMFILECYGFVLNENRILSAESFIMPVVNIAINAIVLFWFLKFFNDIIVNKYRLKYLEINDQEYHLIKEMKERSKTEYFRSIHSAYLAERIATAVGCDVDVCKNLAYYHRLNKAFNLNQKQCKNIFIDNNFPEKAIDTLTDYFNKESSLSSKEAGIVYLADSLIASIQYFVSKDKGGKIDYIGLINDLFDDESVKKSLKNSDLSMRDMRVAKEIMIKEKLYYDFLR